MPNKQSKILSLIDKRAGFHEYFTPLYEASSQVIAFGSYAAGCQNDQSDVDILFVTEKRGMRNEFFDFVCIDPRRISLKSWLGSELANHVAKYGVWLKGDDSWKRQVFIGQSAIDRKKVIILSRLSHLWVKRKSIKHQSTIRLFENVVLDSFRLVTMMHGTAVPPTAIVKSTISHGDRNYLKELIKEKYLGQVAETFLAGLLDSQGVAQIGCLKNTD